MNSYLQIIENVASEQKLRMQELISNWEEGRMPDNVFLEKLPRRIALVPQKVMGTAYIFAYDFEEATRVVNHILQFAFKLCNEINEDGIELLSSAKKSIDKEALIHIPIRTFLSKEEKK